MKVYNNCRVEWWNGDCWTAVAFRIPFATARYLAYINARRNACVHRIKDWEGGIVEVYDTNGSKLKRRCLSIVILECISSLVPNSILGVKRNDI